MGIDRHELEHRNWRSSSTAPHKEIPREIAEQLDTSIVPEDNLGDDVQSPPKVRVKREKTNQLRR
jgi:hypothetical protein